jgi:hypothetical protein
MGRKVRTIGKPAKRPPAENLFIPTTEAEAKWPGGRNQFYRALHDGVVRSLKHGRRFHIYREPYERLLRGELEAERERAAP